MLVVALALVSSLSYGVSDFLGGVAARRVPVLRATTLIYLAATGVLALALLVVPGSWSAAAIGAGAAAGVAALVGFAAFYAALAAGPISILSPGIALLSSAVPVVVGVTVGHERVTAGGWWGIGLAVAAGVLLAGSSDGGASRVGARALLLALVAGLGLGLSIAALDAAPNSSGLVAAFTEVGVGLALLLVAFAAVRRSRRARGWAGRLDVQGEPQPGGGAVPLALWAGVLLGVGNALLLLALHRGDLALVAVLVGLYPVSTVLLALVVLRERVSATQVVGIGVAVAACVVLGLAWP